MKTKKEVGVVSAKKTASRKVSAENEAKTVSKKTTVMSRSFLVIRGEDHERKLKECWGLHVLHNEAAVSYSEVYEAIRQRGLYLSGAAADGGPLWIDASVMSKKAIELARAAQKRNRKDRRTPGKKQEILDDLRTFYEGNVPRGIREVTINEDGTTKVTLGKAGGKTAGTFIGPLLSATSTGGTEVIDLELYETPEWGARWEEAHDQAVDGAKKMFKDKGVKKRPGWFPKLNKDPWNDWEGLLPKNHNWPWLNKYLRSRAPLLKEAERWICKGAGRKFLDKPKKTSFVTRFLEGNPEWPASCLHRIKDYVKQAKYGLVIRRLQKLGVLPLLDGGFIARQVTSIKTKSSPWDKGVLYEVVGVFSKHETDSFAFEQETEKLKADTDSLREKASARQKETEALRRYEQQYCEELTEKNDAPPDSYRLSRRDTRDIKIVRSEWVKSKDKSLEALTEILNKKRKKKIGCSRICCWLLEDENRFVWEDEQSFEAIFVLIRLNGIERKQAERAPAVQFTRYHFMDHPNWVQWEATGKSNNRRNYKLDASGEDDQITIVLPMLVPDGEGRFVEEDREFRLGKHHGAQKPRTYENGKERRIEFTLRTGEVLDAEQKATKMRFDRDKMVNLGADAIFDDPGRLRRLWFEMPFKVDCRPVKAGWCDDDVYPINPAVVHFNNAAGKVTKRESSVKAGLRVMGINMGLNRSLGCSVYEAKAGDCSDRDCDYSFLVGRRWFTAVHERSFLLTSTGDRVNATALHLRECIDAKVMSVKSAIRAIKRVLPEKKGGIRLGKDEEAIEKAVNRLAKKMDLSLTEVYQRALGLMKDNRHRDNRMLLVAMPKIVIYRAFRDLVGERVAELILGIRSPKNASGIGGTSFWNIRLQDDLYDLAKSWEMVRSQKFPGVKDGGLDHIPRGFLKTQRTHLNNLKNDFKRKVANMAVKAARGILPNGQRIAAPCNVIVVEQMTDFRFRADRPRSENNLLMKWCHREIYREIVRQASAYGIQVTEAQAPYISRTDAVTGTPGVRCDWLRARHLRNSAYMEQLAELGMKDVTTGDLIPNFAGRFLVTLTSNDTIRIVDADINAARNLARRFWTRHGELARITVRKEIIPKELEGKKAPRYATFDLGLRMSGALSVLGITKATFIPADDDMGCLLMKSRKKDPGFRALESFVNLHRDMSGVVLESKLWLPTGDFWNLVEKRTVEALQANPVEHVSVRKRGSKAD